MSRARSEQSERNPTEGKSPTRFRAVHVGRRGEVAGGMAQVLNGYADWTFDAFETKFIQSRDGSRGFRAGLVAARAALQLLLLTGASKTVVIVHLSERGSFIREGALLVLARARGFGTVAHLHGSDFNPFARRHPVVVGAVLRAAGRVVVLSVESGETAREFVPSERVVLVPNAVQLGEPTAKQRLIVFGGAVSHRKGVDLLLAAWSQLRENDRSDDWRLIIAGPLIDVSLGEALRQQQRNGVQVLGSVPHRKLLELLDTSMIAVLPSRDEAMPVFILEAMARRNCTIASDVGGIAPVLADGAGMLIPPDDVAALVAALDEAMTDDVRRTRIGENAAASIRARYANAAVFPELEQVWLAAARTSRGRPRDSSRGRPLAG